MTTTERLITAWLAWDRAPASRPACAERVDAIHAAGLNYITAQQDIAAARRAGMSVPDAVMTTINNNGREAA